MKGKKERKKYVWSGTFEKTRPKKKKSELQNSVQGWGK